jgi:hypothetical protein
MLSVAPAAANIAGAAAAVAVVSVAFAVAVSVLAFSPDEHAASDMSDRSANGDVAEIARMDRTLVCMVPFFLVRGEA